jgi:hypothetical protein
VPICNTGTFIACSDWLLLWPEHLIAYSQHVSQSTSGQVWRFGLLPGLRGSRVNSIEQAIRAALDKGDAADQAFRRRIYGSASAAFERSLAGRNYSEEETKTRRQGLLTTIKTIESEFLIAEEPTPSPVGQTQVREKQGAPQLRAANPKTERLHNDQAVRRINIPSARKPRPWLKYALNAAFLLALIIGGFWAYNAGKQILIEATTSKPNGQKPALAETTGVQAEENVDWVQIFSARDTDLVSAPSGAKAEITSRDGINYVVMSGDGGNEVSIKIGSGLMQTFAGKRVLFNIKARSANGSTLDTGAHCNFGADTKCERKRFKIGPQSTEFMFAVNVANQASGDGALLIAPDLSGGGGTVEIETIRATIVQPDAG